MARQQYNNGDDISLQENGCSGCSPTMINGVLCHETGCPESWRDYEIECTECGCDFQPEDSNQVLCNDCQHPNRISEDDAYSQYDDMLNEAYPLDGIACNAFSILLLEGDPTAYECGFVDYCNSMEFEIE
ncbi:MAG: hypothetical protein ACTSRW_17105 [Candidatus Helarchaeota archaeon]